MRFLALSGLALVLLAPAACHCPEPVRPIRPTEMAISRDIASEVGLSYRGCVGNPATFAVENAIWWPYKLLASPFSGIAQGVIGSYGAAGEPIVGTLIAPVGAVLGAVIGTANGFVQQPDVIEANDSLADAFAYPWITDQEIWKTTTPPCGTSYR